MAQSLRKFNNLFMFFLKKKNIKIIHFMKGIKMYFPKLTRVASLNRTASWQVGDGTPTAPQNMKSTYSKFAFGGGGATNDDFEEYLLTNLEDFFPSRAGYSVDSDRGGVTISGNNGDCHLISKHGELQAKFFNESTGRTKSTSYDIPDDEDDFYDVLNEIESDFNRFVND